ncbi:hypothetical protein ACVPPR_01275 [Dellaglioa sp. L3N]
MPTRQDHHNNKIKRNKQAIIIISTILIIIIIGAISFSAGSRASHKRAEQSSQDAASSKATSIALKIAKETSNSLKKANQDAKDAASSSADSSHSDSQTDNTIKSPTSSNALNANDKSEISTDFLTWAGRQAIIGNMAVSEHYFSDGADDSGDWYANTPDGKVQVQNNDNPGANSFKIHAIGGVMFYTANDKTTGIDSSLDSDDDYSLNVNFDKPVSKYLLADNGVVYQLTTGSGTDVNPEDGFAELDTDGTDYDNGPDQDFFVSKDAAAQTELRTLIQTYK